MKLLNNLCKYLFLLVALFSSYSLYAAVADVKVLTLTKISETRVDRTKYDYVFKVTLKNGSDPLSKVVESLTAVGQGTSIIDGNVVVGDLADGAQVTPIDTITLRHDRTYPFNQAALVWNLTSEFPVIASEVTSEKVITLSTGEKAVKGQLVVMTDEALSRAALGLLIAKFKGVIVGQIPEASTYQIELPSNSLESDWLYAKNVLQTSIGILNVSFNTIAEKASFQPYYPNDTAWSSRPYGSNWDDTTWNMKLIRAPEAWGIAYDAATTTTNVKVGIIDGGFKQGSNNSNDELNFENTYSPTGSGSIVSMDASNNDHGMHVSGIIGAQGDNRKGVAGVAWKNTSLYAARTDYTYFSSLTQLTRLLRDGVRVINFSIAVYPVKTENEKTKRLSQEDLDYVIHNSRRSFAIFIDKALKKYDFLFVQGAGNSAEFEFDAKYSGYASSVLSDYIPDAYPNSLNELKSLVNLSNVRAHLISVGAVAVTYDESGNSRKVVMPSYSQSGRSVEIVAPGGDMCVREGDDKKLHAYDRQFDINGNQVFDPSCANRQVFSTFFHVEFASSSGTSMATPHVTGAAALVWQVNPSLNAAQVKSILISTAGGKDGFNVSSPSVEDAKSYPVLNLEKAVLKAKETVGIKFQPEAVTIVTGMVACGSNSTALGDINVLLMKDDLPAFSQTTDDTGVFSFSAKLGKYYLLFWNRFSKELVKTQLFTVNSDPITFKPLIISSTCGTYETTEIKADLASVNGPNNSNIEFVNIPSGAFTMGLTKQKYYKSPAHTILVPAFSMSKYAITFDQYDEFAQATSRPLPSDNGWGRGNRPVINVSWFDAVSYTEWLSSKTGKKVRLPSDSEWEYAARAGTTTEYYWGDLVGVNNANCNGCGGVWNGSAGTSPVGTFAANPWGLFDVSGNVWQWTQDCDHPDYLGAPTDGTAWISGDCGNRVYRGGSWDYPSVNMHLAYSNSYPPSVKTGFIGFRVVMDMSN